MSPPPWSNFIIINHISDSEGFEGEQGASKEELAEAGTAVI